MRAAAYWFAVTLGLLLVSCLLIRVLLGRDGIDALGDFPRFALVFIPIIAGLIGGAMARRPR